MKKEKQQNSNKKKRPTKIIQEKLVDAIPFFLNLNKVVTKQVSSFLNWIELHLTKLYLRDLKGQSKLNLKIHVASKQMNHEFIWLEEDFVK